MGTRDGFVEVEAQVVDLHEGCAAPVVIDGPTPAGLRRRILAREGDRCGNLRCGHRADHCHHIVFRSHGDKTEPGNEVAVCSTCHALVHAGLLRVTGRADGALRWRPVVARDGWVRSDRIDAEMLPVLHLARERSPRVAGPGDGRPSAGADSTGAGVPGAGPTGAESAHADSTETEPDGAFMNRDDLAKALVRLGIPARRSAQLVGAAIDVLPPGARTEAAVLKRALASM